MDLLDCSELIQPVYDRIIDRLCAAHPNVILVEDETDLLDDLSHWAGKGYANLFKHHAFSEGGAALDFAQRNEVAAAVLDCSIGGDRSGIEVAADIQARNPDVNILVSTAYGDFESSEYGEQARRLGVRPCAWFVKPTPVKAVIDSAGEAVRRFIFLQAARIASEVIEEKLKMSDIAIDIGTISRVARDWSSIDFRTGGQLLRRDFPTWRLRRASADCIGTTVEHAVGALGQVVVSRLRSVSPPGDSSDTRPQIKIRVSPEDYELLD